MPNQTIPITLVPGVPAVEARASNLTQLIALVAANIAGSIRADVTFVPQVVNDPASFEGQLIFNIPQRVFKGWDAATGMYLAVTEYVIGDVKNSYVGTDDVSRGWIILNGRIIDNITGITGTQKLALEGLFGTGGSLPTVTPSNITGLPPPNSFGQIVWPPSINPVVQPPAGSFSPGLTFSATVTAAEAQAMADLAETLRTSTDGAFTVTKEIQELCEQFLNAMNNASATPLYAAVFCGYSGA